MLLAEGAGRGQPDPSPTSLSLLLGLRGQRPEAWQRLTGLYGPLVYGWCRRQGLQAADIDDVVQEVFRTVLLRIGDFRRDRPGGTFRGWLWAITRNKLGDHWRRSAAQPQATGGSAARQQLEAVPFDESGEAASAELTALYKRALEMIRGQFEPRTWDAFWQVVCENQRAVDVAERLGLSVNAVYLAKSRILRQLRETLGEVNDGSAAVDVPSTRG